MVDRVSSLEMPFKCKWQGQRVTRPLLISIVLRHQSNNTWELNHLNMQCISFLQRNFPSLLRILLIKKKWSCVYKQGWKSIHKKYKACRSKCKHTKRKTKTIETRPVSPPSNTQTFGLISSTIWIQYMYRMIIPKPNTQPWVIKLCIT